MSVKKTAHSAYEIHYHLVMPLKYRKILIGREVEEYFVWACKEIEKRYEIEFERIGADKNHVHVLCAAAPRYAPSDIIKVIKSLTAREIFRKFPELRKELWGGEFWSEVMGSLLEPLEKVETRTSSKGILSAKVLPPKKLN